MPYRFEYKDWIFSLYRFDEKKTELLCSFPKEQIREVLEETADKLGESSKWVGAMVRIFNHTFVFPPAEISSPSPSDFDDIHLIKYLQSKGYLVFKDNFRKEINDEQIINHLIDKGYRIEKDGQKSYGFEGIKENKEELY